MTSPGTTRKNAWAIVLAAGGIEQNPCKGDAPDAVIDLYRRLPDIDFSHQILRGTASMLRVLRVDHCGWSDLGTPQRVAKVLRRLPRLDDVEDRVYTADLAF
jgi:hypothetical protein